MTTPPSSAPLRLAPSQEEDLDVSVVVPVFNEEDCLEEYRRRTIAALESMNTPFEIVAISDGSTDGSNALLARFAAEDSRWKSLYLARNTGQWAGISAGFQACRGTWVVVMDADLQNRPEDIPRLVAEARAGNWDLVSGRRTERPESGLIRLLPSKIANWFLRRSTGCTAQDMGGFKLLRGSVARQLHLRAGQHRLLPALVHLMGGAIQEIDVKADMRFAGTSKYGLSRTIDVFFDIVMLWFQASFKARPIYLFGRISLGVMSIALLTLFWLGVERIIGGEQAALTSRPFFYLSLTAGSLSVALLGFGLILELISDTRNRVLGIDPYLIRETPPGKTAPQPPEKLKDFGANQPEDPKP
ncbi:MAG: glycosyltransferase family 2 protein [Rhodospirillaceae bacterium]